MADGSAARAVSRSETTKNLVQALIAAQTEFQSVVKDVKGARGKYAPLDSVLQAVRPVLNRHGIAVVQVTDIHGDWMVLRTILRHAGGEEQESLYPVCALGKAPQETGSALTYARRYSLLAICGVHPEDEDDDGEKGAAVAGRPQPRQEPRQEPMSQVERVMRQTLQATTTQEELSSWRDAHKDNMGQIPAAARDELRAEYQRRSRSLPSVNADGELVHA